VRLGLVPRCLPASQLLLGLLRGPRGRTLCSCSCSVPAATLCSCSCLSTPRPTLRSCSVPAAGDWTADGDATVFTVQPVSRSLSFSPPSRRRRRRLADRASQPPAWRDGVRFSPYCHSAGGGTGTAWPRGRRGGRCGGAEQRRRKPWSASRCCPAVSVRPVIGWTHRLELDSVLGSYYMQPSMQMKKIGAQFACWAGVALRIMSVR
jgi:hypothetical protein